MIQIDFPEFLMLMAGNRDTDNDGSTDIDDKARMTREREEELCDMFMMFDQDRGGTISIEELSAVMVKFGGLDKDELTSMLSEADTDGDGQVLNETQYELAETYKTMMLLLTDRCIFTFLHYFSCNLKNLSQ